MRLRKYLKQRGNHMINKSKGINSFQKYLTIWVAVCMIGGVLISKFLPVIPEFFK